MGKRGVIRQLLVSWRRQASEPSSSSGPAAAAASKLEVLEARQLLTAAVDPVITVVWNGQNVQAFQNEYVVELKPGANLSKLVKESNFQDVQDLGGGGTYSLWSDKSFAQMQKWAARRPGSVAAVSPNAVVKPTDIALPNDPFVGDQWQYHNTGQVAPDPAFDPNGQISYFTTGHTGGEPGTPGADIHAAEAWTIVHADPNASDFNKQIVVAVLDTGIDPNHPDLKNQIWTNQREIPDNGIDDDGDGVVDDVHGYNAFANTTDVTDDVGHGTHVAGIIGASGNNSVGVTGVIQDVKILPVKVLGTDGGTTADVIRGINYVTRLKNEGVNIVVANASLGGVDFPFNRVFNDAITRLGQAGTLMTIAAGNDSLNSDIGQNFPGKFSLNQPNVITVAATDNHDNIAFFSNIGAASVQIAAPGLNILSTLPTYDVGTLKETGELVPSGLKNYGYDSGTSMASPMVAGAIALMKAAKPDASPQELKAALLAGADKIPALDTTSTASSPLVTTAGRLNVYRAILNLLNDRTNVDTATRGSWSGAYGSQAAVVYGETGDVEQFSNSTLTARVSGANLQVYADTSNDPDALQQTLNPSSRIASQLTSAGPLTLDLEFNDGQAHRVSLYQADLAGNAGPQTITLVDPDSGTVITSYTTGDLQTGEYDTFQVSPPSTPPAGGTFRVRMVITPNVAGKNAVLNGLFVDPAATDPGVRVVSDPVAGVTNATGGDWRRQFGSEGAKVFGSGTTLGAPITVTGGTQVTAKGKLKKSPAALLQPKANSDKQRVAGYVQTKGSMDITVDLTGYSRPQKLTVYAADLEKLGRAERIDLYDDTTGALLDSVDLTNFAAGKYVSWNVSGKVRIHVTKLAGPNAVVGGVFLDAAPGAPVQYEGMDVSSSGNWQTFYGADASFIFGSDQSPVRRDVYSSNLNTGLNPGPANTQTQSVTVKFTNATNSPPHTVLTGDSRFLIAPGTFQRVSNAKSTGNSMNVDVKFTDMTDHQVALYLVDPSKNNARAERVDIQQIDPNTGKAFTVATQVVTDFSKGKYVVFNARQISPSAAADVRVKITRIKGQTAVVNGVFFG